MKNAPTTSVQLSTVLLAALLLTACQNSNRLTETFKPASAAITNLSGPQPTVSGTSLEQTYDQMTSQWTSFQRWLSSGMMQPHRTVFPH